MSVINNALSELANKKHNPSSPLTRAEVPPVRRSHRLAWLLGGFALSLCVGGWAVSQQAVTVSETSVTESGGAPVIKVSQSASETSAPGNRASEPGESPAKQAESPTQKIIKQADVRVYQDKNADRNKGLDSHISGQQSEPVPVTDKLQEPSRPGAGNVPAGKTAEELPLARLVTEKSRLSNPSIEEPPASEQGSMEIRQVELTPQQLAENAVERAKKALDASKVGEALNEYNTALRYQPGNEVVRQKLAALYYGKRETRRAVEVLQQGIKRNKASQSLRLALAKLLIKEQQPQAALSPLVYLPEQPQIRYLAMRAALAQQNKMTDTALETYQLLVQREADNARWWLGLAIQQERQQSYAAAKASYQKALQRVGVSGKTQAFIRDRLSLLETLEETAHAD